MLSYLGFTHKFLGSTKELGSLLWLCPLQHTHSLSSRFQLVPLHSCCSSLWSFHGIGISKIAGLPCCNWAVFSPLASPGLSSGTPALPHSIKSQLLLMTPSPFQNQIHLGDSYTAKFSCQHEVQTWPSMEHRFFVLTLRKYFAEYFTLAMLAFS